MHLIYFWNVASLCETYWKCKLTITIINDKIQVYVLISVVDGCQGEALAHFPSVNYALQNVEEQETALLNVNVTIQ